MDDDGTTEQQGVQGLGVEVTSHAHDTAEVQHEAWEKNQELVVSGEVLIIPRGHRSALEALGRLDDTRFEDLVARLAQPLDRVDRRPLVDGIVATAGFLERDASALLGSLVHAAALRARLRWSPQQTAEIIPEAADLNLGAETDAFVNRLCRLLELQNVRDVATVTNLTIEHEHLFHDGVVIPEIRPIFSDGDRNDDLVGMVLVFSLKIEFHDEESVRSLFFALDPDDLRGLREALELGEQRAEAIRNVLASAEIPLLELRGGD